MQIDHDPIDSVANQGAYTWSPGAGLVVCHVVRAWYNKAKLTPKSAAEVDSLYAYWPDETGTPDVFFQERVDKIILVPAPNAALVDGLRCKVAVSPAQDATGIDDAIWQTWYGEIAAGAKHRLMRMPEMPWTNPGLSVFYRDVFESAISAAREDQSTGLVGGSVSAAVDARAKRFI
jgi:hypothetical protein